MYLAFWAARGVAAITDGDGDEDVGAFEAGLAEVLLQGAVTNEGRVVLLHHFLGKEEEALRLCVHGGDLVTVAPEGCGDVGANAPAAHEDDLHGSTWTGGDSAPRPWRIWEGTGSRRTRTGQGALLRM